MRWQSEGRDVPSARASARSRSGPSRARANQDRTMGRAASHAENATAAARRRNRRPPPRAAAAPTPPDGSSLWLRGPHARPSVPQSVGPHAGGRAARGRCAAPRQLERAARHPTCGKGRQGRPARGMTATRWLRNSHRHSASRRALRTREVCAVQVSVAGCLDTGART